MESIEEHLASFSGKDEISLAQSLLELCNGGNKCFWDEDWNKAICFYSTCIHLALSRVMTEPQVLSTWNTQEKVKENLLCSYSNRAEARIKLKQYGDAVQDCDKALGLDQHHLKSLFRKGRAFHCLGEYKLACQCFDRALEQSPNATDIQLHFEKSMQLNRQNQKGEFDLSPYFLNGGCKAPELSNYIGPVLIEKSVAVGRGLFATENVDIGDFLLVDNAVALTCTETTTLRGRVERSTELKRKHELIKRGLKAKIMSCAASSPRVLQQLEYIADSDEVKIPPMDLFRVNNASWNTYDVCNQAGWELDQHKFEKIMLHVACHTQPIESRSHITRQIEQYGLWALPSFINHSCSPNANYTVVGEAMFVIAARKIEVGEEITVSYVTGFEPLFRRESAFRAMGFKCECKRCVLERSLIAAEASPLREIAEIPETMMLSDAELCEYAMGVENSIQGLTSEEKQMIRASYLLLYFDMFWIQYINPNARIPNFPSLREVFDGFQDVVPGSSACLIIFGRFPVYAKNEAETDKVLFQKTMEVCRAYMGKHEEGRLKAVLNSISKYAFNPGYTVFLSTKTINYDE